jgi:phosphoribosylformimino-5-aminoimidazole carboxamide ribotide isomerase
LKDFLIPAIDLKEGRLVRLYRGQEDQAKVYSEKPEEVARFFEGLGFSRLHVVDLDGAFGGVPRNLQAIRNIRKVFSGTIQVGGGIRSMETLKILDEEGINLFVVGTVALKNPQLFEEMLTAFPGRLILSVDSKGGKVSVGGWKEESPYTPQDLAKVWDPKPYGAIFIRWWKGMAPWRVWTQSPTRSSKGFQKSHSSPAVGWQACRI